MKKNLVAGSIAGIFLTELLQYFAPQSPVLFYLYVMVGAACASVVSRRIAGGFLIAGYVVAWKIAGMFYLTQTYGIEAIARGFSPFLIAWILVFFVGIAGGYAGTALSRYKNSTVEL
jgi:predicted metal-binding membrane protein